MMPQLIGGWGSGSGTIGGGSSGDGSRSAGRGADYDRFRLARPVRWCQWSDHFQNSISCHRRPRRGQRDARKAARITPIPHLPERASYETITRSLLEDRSVVFPAGIDDYGIEGRPFGCFGCRMCSWWDAPVLT